MKIYQVGGSIRDELLGEIPKDKDWLVVGSSPEEMIAAGYKPIGKDFPVFIHPISKEEYALARTEKKRKVVMVIRVLPFILVKMLLLKKTSQEEILQLMQLQKIQREN